MTLSPTEITNLLMSYRSWCRYLFAIDAYPWHPWLWQYSLTISSCYLTRWWRNIYITASQIDGLNILKTEFQYNWFPSYVFPLLHLKIFLEGAHGLHQMPEQPLPQLPHPQIPMLKAYHSIVKIRWMYWLVSFFFPKYILGEKILVA